MIFVLLIAAALAQLVPFEEESAFYNEVALSDSTVVADGCTLWGWDGFNNKVSLSYISCHGIPASGVVEFKIKELAGQFGVNCPLIQNWEKVIGCPGGICSFTKEYTLSLDACDAVAAILTAGIGSAISKAGTKVYGKAMKQLSQRGQAKMRQVANQLNGLKNKKFRDIKGDLRSELSGFCDNIQKTIDDVLKCFGASGSIPGLAEVMKVANQITGTIALKAIFDASFNMGNGHIRVGAGFSGVWNIGAFAIAAKAAFTVVGQYVPGVGRGCHKGRFDIMAHKAEILMTFLPSPKFEFKIHCSEIRFLGISLNDATNAIKNAGQAAAKWGGNAARDIKNGVNNAVKAADDAARRVADAARRAAEETARKAREAADRARRAAEDAARRVRDAARRVFSWRRRSRRRRRIFGRRNLDEENDSFDDEMEDESFDDEMEDDSDDEMMVKEYQPKEAIELFQTEEETSDSLEAAKRAAEEAARRARDAVNRACRAAGRTCETAKRVAEEAERRVRDAARRLSDHLKRIADAAKRFFSWRRRSRRRRRIFGRRNLDDEMEDEFVDDEQMVSEEEEALAFYKAEEKFFEEAVFMHEPMEEEEQLAMMDEVWEALLALADHVRVVPEEDLEQSPEMMEPKDEEEVMLEELLSILGNLQQN